MNRLCRAMGLALCLVAAGCSGGLNEGGLFGGTLMNAADERAVGHDAHREIMARHGGAYGDEDLGARVAILAGRLAGRAAGEAPVRVTVLDTPSVNAFAAPGGYIYVTRGLLALANDEAELAGVLAHEMGHVTSHHGARRHTEAVKAQLLSGFLTTVLGEGKTGSAVRRKALDHVADYSRNQEFEADAIGARTIARAGYAPEAMASFLENLGRYHDLALRSRDRPVRGAEAFVTHPATRERVRRVRALVAGDAALAGRALKRNRSGYLAMLDGLVYGKDPRGGILDGRRYVHAGGRVAFSVPEGFFAVENAGKLIALGPGPRALAFSIARLPAGMGPADYLENGWFADVELTDRRSLVLAGLEAASARTVHGEFRLHLYAIRGEGAAVYRFALVAPKDMDAARLKALDATVRGFTRISAGEALRYKPARLRLRQVKPGQSAADLARRMDVPARKLEIFRILNGLKEGDGVRVGQWVKLVGR